MSFVVPAFLFALGALAIPVIIHLFYFKRFKKVYFTNVRFLKSIKEETTSRSKIKQWVILATRLLALLFLVLAFAQPFLPQGSTAKKGTTAVSVYIDNSFSMSALATDVALLEKAKLRAREIINAYGEEHKFQVLTNDFEGRHQRLVSKQDALNYVDEVKATPTVRPISMVVARQQQALASGTAATKRAYVLSDFQRSSADVGAIKDTLMEVNLVPLTAVAQKNVSIDSCWLAAPVPMVNQVNALVVRLKNHSPQPAENVRITLTYDGQEKPVGTRTLPANGSSQDTIKMSLTRTGWQEATVKVTDYPVQFDDTYYFAFNVVKQLNVLIINETTESRYLNTSFKTAPIFNTLNLPSRSLDYSKFGNYQLIILNEVAALSSGLVTEIGQYIRNGGNVLVFPSATGNIESYRNLLAGISAGGIENLDRTAREVAALNTDSYVFSNVFENKKANLKLPKTTANYRLLSPKEVLMTYRDGSAFLTRSVAGNGNLYMCAAPLQENYSDLVKNGEVFIPMLFKMAISTGKEPVIAYTIGDNNTIEVTYQRVGKESVFKLKGTKEEFIPPQRSLGNKLLLTPDAQLREAGFYRLYARPDSILAHYAFNYNRLESELGYLSPEDLQTAIKHPNIKVIAATAQANFTNLVGEQNKGITLWKYCVWAALLLLLLEVLLLRFWK